MVTLSLFVGGPGPAWSSSCVLSLPSRMSSLHVLVVSLWGSLVIVCCCAVLLLLSVSWPRRRCPMSSVRCRAVCEQGALRRTEGGTYCGALTTTNED